MRLDGDKVEKLALAKHGTKAAFLRALRQHEDCEALAEGRMRDWFASIGFPHGPHAVAVERELDMALADLVVDGEPPRKRV